MSNSPVASVLIPVYNADRYLRSALEAVLNQAEKDIEVIVVDDGSTDGSLGIASSYKDYRVHVLPLEKNVGIAKALNLGLSRCTGKYVIRTDADDIAKPNLVSEIVAFLEANSDYVACGSNMEILGSPRKICYPKNDTDLRVHTLHSCPFSHSCVGIRRMVLVHHGIFYPEDLPDAEDYGLWSRLLMYGRFHNLQKELLYYRESASQITQKLDYEKRRSLSRRKIYMRQAAEYFGFDDEQSALYAESILCTKGDRWEVAAFMKCFGDALEVNHERKIFSESNLLAFYSQRVRVMLLSSSISFAGSVVLLWNFTRRCNASTRVRIVVSHLARRLLGYIRF